MRVIVAGSREPPHDAYKTVCDKLGYYLRGQDYSGLQVVSGTCRGYDLLSERWAKRNRVEIVRFPANWDDIDVQGAVVKYNRQGKAYNAVAGHQRNRKMADYSDCLVAFWDSKSSGTQNMIYLAKAYGLQVRVVLI